MKKTTGIALLSAAAMLAPALANAAETLPWTYVEAAYNRPDGSEFFETEAYQVTASVGFLKQWHAQLEYTDGESDTDFFADDPEFDGYRLVVGAHPQITEKTQLIANLNYFDYDGEFDSNDEFGSKGYGIGFGLRHAISPKLEVSGLVTYIDAEFEETGDPDSDFNDTIIEVSGRYNWTTNFSTGLTVGFDNSWAGVAADDSDTTARFDVRWAFGNNDLWDLM